MPAHGTHTSGTAYTQHTRHLRTALNKKYMIKDKTSTPISASSHFWKFCPAKPRSQCTFSHKDKQGVITRTTEIRMPIRGTELVSTGPDKIRFPPLSINAIRVKWGRHWHCCTGDAGPKRAWAQPAPHLAPPRQAAARHPVAGRPRRAARVARLQGPASVRPPGRRAAVPD